MTQRRFLTIPLSPSSQQISPSCHVLPSWKARRWTTTAASAYDNECRITPRLLTDGDEHRVEVKDAFVHQDIGIYLRCKGHLRDDHYTHIDTKTVDERTKEAVRQETRRVWLTRQLWPCLADRVSLTWRVPRGMGRAVEHQTYHARKATT